MTYRSSGGEGPRRPDPYRPLRNMEGGEPGWPLEDPSVPAATPPRSSTMPFAIGLIVGVGLALVSVIGFQALRRSPAEDPSLPAAGVIDTTAPSVATTVAPVTTALPPATTTSTTLAATSSVPAIEPFGEPLDIGDLRLAADAIGPLNFGNNAAPVLGRLVSSLGPPDEDSGEFTSAGEFGTCAGDLVRVVRWGPLAVVVVPSVDGPILGGFRLDLAFGGLDSRAATISTLSGLRAGDAVSELEVIYADTFTIEYREEPELGMIFELRRTDATNLLLWGPVTEPTAEGIVTGIYSPDPCA